MNCLPRRIVCLTPETADVLYRIGAAEYVVGVSCFAPPAPDGRKRPIVSVFTTVKYEDIDALKPDLVLAFSDLQADVVRELGRRGHNVLLTNQRTLAEVFQMMAMVGALVDKAQATQRLIDALRSDLVAAQREADADGEDPPVIYFEEWDDPLITGIGWVSEMIEAAGGRDAFGELRNRPTASQRIVEPAAVAERRPDIILASWCGKRVKRHVIRARLGWHAIPAVRDNEVHEIRSAHCLQPGRLLIAEGLPRIRAIVREWHQRRVRAE